MHYIDILNDAIVIENYNKIDEVILNNNIKFQSSSFIKKFYPV